MQRLDGEERNLIDGRLVRANDGAQWFDVISRPSTASQQEPG